ncbi:MAG: O-antigen ligase family protein, partial [Chitinophagaceae bacterium]
MNFVLRIFNYRFFVWEFMLLFFLYLLMENIFSWLIFPVSIVVLAYEKILSILVYAYVLYRFTSLKLSERIYVGLFSLILARLVFESLTKYDSIFQQFTMFTVLDPVIFVIFIKSMLRSQNFDILEFIAKFHLLTYIIFMVIYGKGFSFSLDSVDMIDYGPFSGDSRIVHARSIFVLIIPFLWYLHSYITTKKNKFLFPFILIAAVILLHQHRSVWSSTLVALFFYLMASVRNKKQTMPRLLTVAIGTSVVLVFTYFFVSSLIPTFLEFLTDRFSEILNPAKEGSTGNFRIEQREVYFKMFLERPIFGWTFEGFEMPNPLVDWWPEMSGQHFHEGYMEMLFYHGVVGLLLKYSF